jgi:hypothetical protein
MMDQLDRVTVRRPRRMRIVAKLLVEPARPGIDDRRCGRSAGLNAR